MTHRIFPALFLILGMLLSGCSGLSDPVNPAPAPDIKLDQLIEIPGTDRYLVGLWEFLVSEDHQRVEAIPLRTADFHVNLTYFLEVAPCDDCVKVLGVISPSAGELLILLRLRNTFSKTKVSGFNVRGIFITGGDKEFPSSGRRISWNGDYPVLLNADGYTDIFNPTEYPEDGPEETIFKYITGKYAQPEDLSATLNPYVSYQSLVIDDRQIFTNLSQDDRWFHLKVPAGPLKFGYAIDASWENPEDEITTPTEMPLEADIREARSVEVLTGNNLTEVPGSSASIQVRIIDHQGAGTIESVTVEAPDLFNGTVSLSYDDDWDGEFDYSGTITNSLGASEGTYPLLVKVTDTETDPLLGENAAWQVAPVRVSDNWVHHWGAGKNSSDCYNSTVDIFGNSFCFGHFDGGTDLSPGDTSDFFDAGIAECYLAKFNQDGSFDWATDWMNPGTDSGVTGINLDTDSDGNVFLAGCFYGVRDVDPGPDEDLQGTNGELSAYLGKFSAAGSYEWTVVWDARGRDLEILDDGSVLVCGIFSGAVDFDPGPDQVLVDSEVTGTGFITHFDTNGNFLDVIGMYPTLEYIETGSDGNIYIAGHMWGTIDFDPHPVDKYELVPVSDCDFFIAGYMQNMYLLWAVNWGGSDPGSYGGYQGITDLHCDKAGSIYMTGTWFGTMDFDPTVYWDIRVSNPYGSLPLDLITDPYIVRYSTDGTYIWAYTEGSPENDIFKSVDTDPSGNILVSGLWDDRYYETPVALSKYRMIDTYLTLFDPSAHPIWENRWAYNAFLVNAQFGPSGAIYTFGKFGEWADFDPGEDIFTVEAVEEWDFYIQRLNSDGTF